MYCVIAKRGDPPLIPGHSTRGCEGKRGRQWEVILPSTLVSSGSVIPPTLHLHIHRNITSIRTSGRNPRTFKQRFFLEHWVWLRIPLFWDVILCNIRRFDRSWCLRRESIAQRHSAISQENSILYLQIPCSGFKRLTQKYTATK